MKKTVAAISLISALIIGLAVFYLSRPAVPPPSTSTGNQQPQRPQQWEARTDEQVNVSVLVTPVDLSQQSVEWQFDIGMSTHSVELNQDMIASAVLVGDNNKEHQPIKWTGPTGGHHREGVLSFAPIAPYPRRLTLKIKGIGGVNRLFSWTLN